jgi:hypothetical protein
MSGSGVELTLGYLTNPAAPVPVGKSGKFSVSTTDANDLVLNEKPNIPAPPISCESRFTEGPTVTSSEPTVNLVNELTFELAICNPLPADGIVEVTLDPQFQVDGSLKVTHSMSGDVVVYAPVEAEEGIIVTIKRTGSGFDILSGTKITIAVNGVRNPKVKSPNQGEGGTFGVSTFADSAISGQLLLDNAPAVTLNETFVGVTLQSSNDMCMAAAVEWTPTAESAFKSTVGESHDSPEVNVEVKSVKPTTCIDTVSRRRLQALGANTGFGHAPAQNGLVLQLGSDKSAHIGILRKLVVLNGPPSSPRNLMRDDKLTTDSDVSLRWTRPTENFDDSISKTYTLKYKRAGSSEALTVRNTGSSDAFAVIPNLAKGTE